MISLYTRTVLCSDLCDTFWKIRSTMLDIRYCAEKSEVFRKVNSKILKKNLSTDKQFDFLLKKKSINFVLKLKNLISIEIKI